MNRGVLGGTSRPSLQHRSIRVEPYPGEAGIESVVALATDVVQASYLRNERFPRFQITADGTISWGNGTAAPSGRASVSAVIATPGVDERLTLSGDFVNITGPAGAFLRFANNGSIDRDNSTGDLVITPQTQLRFPTQIVGINAAAVPLTVRGKASQTGDLQQWQNSSGTVLARIDASGEYTSSGATISVNRSQFFTDSANTKGYFETGVAGINFQLINRATANIPLVIKAIAAQTANLQEWRDSAAAVVFSVDVNGFLKWAAGKEQTTVGAAGAASALPATPTKYLQVKDSAGTTYVIPAYAAA